MKKALFVSLVIVLCILPLIFSNYHRRVTENSEANLSQIPYTFTGGQGDWQVQVDIRGITQADFDQLLRYDSQTDISRLQDGFRSAVRIFYTGPERIKSLSYTFGKSSQWKYGGDLTINLTSDTINTALTGTYDLAGVAYARDASVGGPVPPKDHTFEFDLVAQTTQGKEITAEMTLSATK